MLIHDILNTCLRKDAQHFVVFLQHRFVHFWNAVGLIRPGIGWISDIETPSIFLSRKLTIFLMGSSSVKLTFRSSLLSSWFSSNSLRLSCSYSSFSNSVSLITWDLSYSNALLVIGMLTLGSKSSTKYFDFFLKMETGIFIFLNELDGLLLSMNSIYILGLSEELLSISSSNCWLLRFFNSLILFSVSMLKYFFSCGLVECDFSSRVFIC